MLARWCAALTLKRLFQRSRSLQETLEHLPMLQSLEHSRTLMKTLSNLQEVLRVSKSALKEILQCPAQNPDSASLKSLRAHPREHLSVINDFFVHRADQPVLEVMGHFPPLPLLSWCRTCCQACGPTCGAPGCSIFQRRCTPSNTPLGKIMPPACLLLTFTLVPP